MFDLRQYCEPDIVIYLVGNKVDIVESNPSARQVSHEEGKVFAKENKLQFIETSAFSNYRVTEAFENLLEG